VSKSSNKGLQWSVCNHNSDRQTWRQSTTADPRAGTNQYRL